MKVVCTSNCKHKKALFKDIHIVHIHPAVLYAYMHKNDEYFAHLTVQAFSVIHYCHNKTGHPYFVIDVNGNVVFKIIK